MIPSVMLRWEAQQAFYKLDAMIGAARLYCRMHGSIFRIDTIILWHSRVFFDPKDTDSTGAFYGGEGPLRPEQEPLPQGESGVPCVSGTLNIGPGPCPVTVKVLGPPPDEVKLGRPWFPGR